MPKKKPKKKTRIIERLDPTERIQRAKKIYLDYLGKISDREIAEIMGVSRQTVLSWRQKGKWQELVDKAAESELYPKKVAEKIAMTAEVMSEEAFANMKLISFLVRQKMVVHDERGRPVIKDNGQPKVNEKLSPSDLRALASTMEVYQRMVRLESGMSTSNEAKQIDGKITVTQDEPLESALRRMVQDGDSDGQDMLLQMVEARQKLLDKYGGE